MSIALFKIVQRFLKFLLAAQHNNFIDFYPSAKGIQQLLVLLGALQQNNGFFAVLQYSPPHSGLRCVRITNNSIVRNTAGGKKRNIHIKTPYKLNRFHPNGAPVVFVIIAPGNNAF